MPTDKKRLLAELADIVRKGLEVAGIIAEQLTSLDDGPGEPEPDAPRQHSDCDRAVFAFVKASAANPPTKQEIVAALSERTPKVASSSTVEKSVTRLAREGYIEARPRPVFGYVVARELEDA